jgi:hypothetical protein
MNAFQGFTAPPARQAINPDRLPVWGRQVGDDLPPTAFFRRHSRTIEATTIAAAIAAAAAFILPFVLAR